MFKQTDLLKKTDFPVSLRNQLGANLIEILVSLALFSAGVLALTNNINGSMRDLSVANFHASAVLAADDLVMRIRNNPTGFADGSYARTRTSIQNISEEALTPCGDPCAPVDIASKDLRQWADTYSESIGNAFVTIRGSNQRVTLAFAYAADASESLEALDDCLAGDAIANCYLTTELVCEPASDDATTFCAVALE